MQTEYKTLKFHGSVSLCVYSKLMQFLVSSQSLLLNHVFACHLKISPL